VLGDSGSGRTSTLRAYVHALAARHSAAEARLFVVDFRRGLGDLETTLASPCQFASRPPQAEEALASLRELCVERGYAPSRV
jgi:S-DNA-T family DNA segregation ATPase FtsK/SpoIIIE